MSHQEQPLVVSVMGLSDVGLVRANNEDCFLIADLTQGVEITTPAVREYASGPGGSLFVVADGMGGAAAGEVASRMAVESIATFLRTSRYSDRLGFCAALDDSIDQANRLIYRESRRNGNLRGMGTTLTAAGVYDASVLFAQVGDSRAYLVRNHHIVQMTRDQSLVAQLVASGRLSPEGAKTHPQRNVILQALGAAERVDAVFSVAELRLGDWLILCSDGLSGKIEDQELQEIVKQCSAPKDACEKMVAVARDRGGEDNITVIAARFDGERLLPPGPREAAVYQEFKLH